MTVAIEVGSTNVYADLGYADAAEMQRKSSLAAEIARCIKARHLTQDAASQLLGIDQASRRSSPSPSGSPTGDRR